MMRLSFAVSGLVVATLGSAALGQSNVRPVARVAAPAGAALTLGAVQRAVDPLASYARLEADQSAPEHQHVVSVDFAGRHQPSANLEGGGSLATQRGQWSATLAREWEGRRLLAVALESEATFFDFGGAGALVPGSDDPFNDLYRTSLGATLYSPWNGALSVFAGTEFTLAGEDTSDLSGSLILAGSLGVTYRAHRDLELALGVSASQRLEDEPWVIPFLGVHWHFAEGWKLSAEGERVGLAVELGSGFELSFQAAYEQRQYRLNDTNPLPRGVFRDEQIDLGASLAWRPSEGVELRVGGGYTPWRELTFLEEGGAGSEREVENAPFGELALRLSF